MPVSRLRLQLAAGFALAFGLGLALLALGALGYLRRESERRLDARLTAVARGVAEAMVREEAETPDSTMAFAAHEVRDEWPSPGDRWVIVASDGRVLAATDTTAIVARMVARAGASEGGRFTLADGDDDVDAIAVNQATTAPVRADGHFRVIAWGSTEGIEQDARLLATVLAVTAPLLVLFSLAAGYLLASGALRPARDLGAAIAAIAPDDLSRRLPTTGATDEVSALADEFNRLLDRVQEAQLRNQRFVREAAHQIRTPLTLVLGEADLVVRGESPSPDATHHAVARIRTAAEVMRHRVDDLMLLAEAQAGSRPRLEETVELDGLALECTDLMRARATALGCSLALGTVQALAVRGNEHLLREALLELLENACRHGDAASPVTTEVVAVDGMPAIRVTSAVSEARHANAERHADAEGSGLGMQIVRWIAQEHGGRIDVEVRDGQHVATLVLANATTA